MSENSPREDAARDEQTEVVPPPPPPEHTDPTPPESVPEPPAPGGPPPQPEAPGTPEPPASPEPAVAPPPPPPPGGSAAPPPPPGQPYPVAGYQQPAAQQEWSQPYGGQAPTQTTMSPQEEKTWGLASHGVALAATIFSGGVLSFVAAVVMYVLFKDRGPFVRAHAANALNVQIIASIVFLVSLPLMFVLVGFLTFAIAWVLAVIAHIIGMVRANSGQWWDPPLTPKFVR